MARSLVTATRRLRSRASGTADQGGFTVVEVIVAIALVTIVMTSLAEFFVTSSKVIDNQSQRQTASQLATDALEAARAQAVNGVTTQRGSGASQVAWNGATADGSPYPGVAAYLTNVSMAYDVSAPAGSGANAPLSTNGRQVTINGTTFTQTWFFGTCYARPSDGSCASSRSVSYPTQYMQVVVDVTWPGKQCRSVCSYVTATRFSTSPDPLFDSGQSATKPTIVNPGNQISDAGSPIAALALSSTGGTAPLTWSAVGLPDGLILDTSTSPVTITGTPSSAGTAQVTLTLADAFGFTSTAKLTWTVAPKLTLTNPGNQSSKLADTVTLSITATGGTGAPVYAATGLPAGLSINKSTGAISGTPTTATPTGKPAQVTVSVTDAANGTDSVSFTWTVTGNPLRITSPPATRSDAVGSNVSLTAKATGGTGKYTWVATGLPQGLSINSSSGAITGTISNGYRYVTTLTVTDAKGNTASTTVIWTATGDLTVAGVIEQSSKINSSVVIAPLSVSGGRTGSGFFYYYDYSFSAPVLPPGLKIDSSTGAITGTPTQAGTFTITVTVNNTYHSFFNTSIVDNATAMFVWTVTK